MIDQHQTDLSQGAEPKGELPRCGEPKGGGREAHGQGRIAHAIKSSGMRTDGSCRLRLVATTPKARPHRQERDARSYRICEEALGMFEQTSVVCRMVVLALDAQRSRFCALLHVNASIFRRGCKVDGHSMR